MYPKLIDLYKLLKKNGLTPEQEQKILEELETAGSHEILVDNFSRSGRGTTGQAFQSIYAYHDLLNLQGMIAMQSTPNVSVRSIDELLERDKQREKDGFPRKINVGRLIKPGKSGKDKVVIVPSTVEEKFLHDTSFRTDDEQAGGGS